LYIACGIVTTSLLRQGRQPEVPTLQRGVVHPSQSEEGLPMSRYAFEETRGATEARSEGLGPPPAWLR